MIITMAGRFFSFQCFLLIIIIIFLSQARAQPNFTPFCMDEQGNYTLNSTYHNNLNTLLSNLLSNSTQTNYNGFYNLSYGQAPDKIEAIALCRGDLKPDECLTCLNTSRFNLTQHYCPNQKEAIGYIEECMLRYSNRPIFGVMEKSPTIRMRNVNNNVIDVDEFNKVLGNLLNGLRARAMFGDSRLKYATGNVSSPNFPVICMVWRSARLIFLASNVIPA